MPEVFEDTEPSLDVEETKLKRTIDPSKPKQNSVAPQLTFVEEEVKNLVGYLNFVAEHGVFKVKPRQMAEFIKLNGEVVKLAKKCEAHIFEIKEYIKASKP